MISTRLSSLAKYIKKEDKLIDVGCDHALLDIYLIENNICKYLIASDINESALNQGIKNVNKKSLNKKIDLRLGNGLDVLKSDDNINTILISGMGTSTILEILNHEYLNNINKLIIQSNNDHTMLRENIIKLGFKIDAEEYLVDNNKNYINIVFIRGNNNYSKIELRYGPFLIKDINYLNFELNNINKILGFIPKNKIFLRIRLKKEKRLIKKLIKSIYK